MKVVLADYGAGNLRSVCSALARAGAEPVVTTDPAEVAEAPLAVIAGVGNAESAARAPRGRPASPTRCARGSRRAGRVLGICLGMQLLFEESEEGGRGLGVLRGPVVRLQADRVPHMGWNDAAADGADGAARRPRRRGRLLRALVSPACPPNRSPSPKSTTAGPVVAAVERGAVAGVQFHPERSGRAGRADPPERDRMVKKRLIPCLDVAGGRVVKGVRFEALRDVGDPVELATRYSELGADELVFLDVTATRRGPRGRCSSSSSGPRPSSRSRSRSAAASSSLEDARGLLRAGADKVAVNRAAVDDRLLLTALADEFGAQAVVCAIDSRGGEVVTHGGRTPRGLDAVDWARGGGRSRGRRDPAHLDRRRRDARRLRPRADRRGRATRCPCP